MKRRFPAVLAIALLLPLAGCESNGGGSTSVGFYGSYGYYSGYYPGYGYWYDDDDAVEIRPPEDRPERPTTLPERPEQLPAERPSASTRPSTTSSSSMSRPASRPMPRSRGRR